MVRIFEYQTQAAEVEQMIRTGNVIEPQILLDVAKIVDGIAEHGDAALEEYRKRFGWDDISDCIVTEEEKEQAYREVDDEFIRIIQEAKANIYRYHLNQRQVSWFDNQPKGVMLGQMVVPLKRVGLYVPGGSAAYPSSVLMTAVPAKVAGVDRIVMCSPPAPDGSLNPYTLVAAAEAGVDEIWKIGGARAVAAMAYGTKTLAAVDKICGPGNIFVTAAKKLVYGQVDIDMLAGPSEIVVIADETGKPDFIAADMLSQAEHDVKSEAVLITTDRNLAAAVQQELELQLAKLGRSEIATQALDSRGAIIIVHDVNQAVWLANRFAPEHLEIMTKDPMTLMGDVRAAGAIFIGDYSPEPVGDYFAGSNHVLPTSGTARFYSALGVRAYLKYISVVRYSKEALKTNGGKIIRFAETEGLDAHANSIKIRMVKE